jgi:hypothetical protein
MDCNKWQEEGLLYVSHELGAAQVTTYEKHVQGCAACQDELSNYLHDKKSFFNADVLCEAPSQAIDDKIIAACTRLPRATHGAGIFSSVWFKRALISSVFLIFGTTAGVYFTMNYYNGAANPGGFALNKASANMTSQMVLAKSADSMQALKKDSLTKKPVEHFANRLRPNPSTQGIITVDLKKE